MEILQIFITQLWTLTAEMAPYLLLGFLLAGLIRVFITPQWVQNHLGKTGFIQTVKASLLGVPLPLCSCGIIPVAASIRKQGGSSGAVASFTASTPQTGIDSIIATGALLSWPFAFIRVIAAFISGIIAGILVDYFTRQREAATEGLVPSSCCASKPPPIESEKACCQHKAHKEKASLRDGLHFGLRQLPDDIGKALLIGLILAAIVSTFLPAHLDDKSWTSGIVAYLIVSVFSIPLYVCSTGSIPMAFALITAGFSPGTALIFLVAGPATNTATVVALWKMIGRQATILYIFAIILVAWVTGGIIDSLSIQIPFSNITHEMNEPLFFQQLSACLLIILLIPAFIHKRSKEG